MSPDQFAQLLSVLTKLADRTYTLTGAADWPIMATLAGLLIAVLGWMWVDLKATIKEGRSECRGELDKFKTEHEKEHSRIWQAHRDCQIDCCIKDKR
jgi:hypothetical protein